MSYQYPPPPPNGADMDMSSSGYLPGYSVPPHAPLGMDPDTGIPSRERSDSLKLTRSISTPVVGQSQSQGQASQPSTPQQSIAPGQDPSGEKRRNKLGYHRTSVACD
ncbi:3cd8da19-27c3-4cd8-a58a-cebf11dd32a6 [Thermothielavioides terrestris]|uniref:3cd8da19-27c3-4cd8-a58a-cebf11dd32a6 n=1 Tax=Thermothielavioides terrestris TaxID=2587410 RepID=A0A446B8C8_9PEZI|nr:3cd8da19-27c3-4cd8-a58a-cebf11dd32a6 [Thermothielavioides terrestris]